MNIPSHQYHRDAALLDRIKTLHSEVNIQRIKISGLVENELPRNQIDTAILECFANLEELSDLEKSLGASHPFELARAHKLILQMALFLLVHTDAEKPMATKISALTRRLFEASYPSLSYYSLNFENKLFHWLRREGVGYKVPRYTGRYEYVPRFPVSDSDLDEFFMENRKQILEIMVYEIGPQSLVADPLLTDHEAIEYFTQYKEFLRFSPMKQAPQDGTEPRLLAI